MLSVLVADPSRLISTKYVVAKCACVLYRRQRPRPAGLEVWRPPLDLAGRPLRSEVRRVRVNVDMSEKILIAPHGKVKGVDFLGCCKTYIIRSDIGRYAVVESNYLHDTKKKEFDLHPSCVGGDHYMGYEHAPQLGGADYDYCFIIKGDDFRKVTDLSTDANAKTGTLHPKCRGGDFYLGTSKYHRYSVTPIFIVIFSKEGKFRAVSDLVSADPAKYLQFDGSEEYSLHDSCKEGLYYWSTKSYWKGNVWYYVLKGVDKWGVKVHYTKDLHTDEGGYDEHINPCIVKFLPYRSATGETLYFLSEGDLTNLFAKLQKCASKWRDIARELGIGYSQQREIVHEQGNKSDSDYFEAMLSRWLKHAPPTHQLSSVQKLQEALQLVGEEKLALQLSDFKN